ncbi:MAG: mannose-6-phosphate isomerase [Candidatus Hydrogenedentes bacterium]|jgi:mannose-6-phosphate isomerase|nr:mannose-6-phosphate isomerase [Candidatus Hydrogenedentota bacterium]
MNFGFLKFKAAYMERLWGGTQLSGYLNTALSGDQPIGEAWLIADHEVHCSVVSEGPFTGHTLRQLIALDGVGLLGNAGKNTPGNSFPLLLKLIDADADLSVQVHPDDTLASCLEGLDNGKTEMWYVLGSKKDSRLLLGLQPDVDQESFERAAHAGGDLSSMMQSVPAQIGAFFFVPAGVVHAIGAGIMVAEIQQNSDITYRLYDYNRVEKGGERRTLHLDKALQSLQYDQSSMADSAPSLAIESEDAVREYLCACPYFAAEKVQTKGQRVYCGDSQSFHIVLATEEPLLLISEESRCTLQRGEAALVPASLKEWSVQTTGTYLDYYVPRLLEDVVMPLRLQGYRDEQIESLAGMAGSRAIFDRNNRTSISS